MLDSLLESFPWQGDDDANAVGLSMLISPMMRACLPTVPMHCVSAPTPGTGKSFLCDLAAALATGFPCVVMAAGRDEEELEKRLSSAVLDGMPVAAIDNVSRPLGGDFLCQVLDRPLVKVRVLGKSEGPKLEPRLILFATGNNLTLIGDIGRRAVIAHMDAACENPHQRQFADNPLTRIMRDRGTYIAAALTLCRAFKLSGEPPEARLASFEHWSDIVRSAIRWAGGGDAVRTMATIAEDDPARERHAAVLVAWEKVFGSDEVSVAEIIKRGDRARPGRRPGVAGAARRADGGGRHKGRHARQPAARLLAAPAPRQGAEPACAAAIDLGASRHPDALVPPRPAERRR